MDKIKSWAWMVALFLTFKVGTAVGLVWWMTLLVIFAVMLIWTAMKATVRKLRA